jgi:hypothetical protein
VSSFVPAVRARVPPMWRYGVAAIRQSRANLMDENYTLMAD